MHSSHRPLSLPQGFVRVCPCLCYLPWWILIENNLFIFIIIIKTFTNVLYLSALSNPYLFCPIYKHQVNHVTKSKILTIVDSQRSWLSTSVDKHLPPQHFYSTPSSSFCFYFLLFVLFILSKLFTFIISHHYLHIFCDSSQQRQERAKKSYPLWASYMVVWCF